MTDRDPFVITTFKAEAPEPQPEASITKDPQDKKLERQYKKKAWRLNRQLHEELSKNVELHTQYNRALSILRKVNSTNRDLLEALSIVQPEDSDLAPAPPVVLNKEQKELFNMLNL